MDVNNEQKTITGFFRLPLALTVRGVGENNPPPLGG